MSTEISGTMATAAELLPHAGLRLSGLIRDSRWSTVVRVRAAAPGWSGPKTLIVKRYPEAGTAWAREGAALAVAPAEAPAPRLVASSASPPLVVMTDAGTGPSVADALLTGTTAEASAALEGFADALAAFHLRTLDAGKPFASELAARSGGSVPPTVISDSAAQAAERLGTWCSRLGVAVPGGALPTLAALPDRIPATSPSALTSSDICPDNNIRAGEEYVLIDFEDAEWRPIAWDAAYLMVPWPGCWCSFDLPSAVADQTLERYRAAIAGRLPYAATPAFTSDVALAALGWALIAASWYIRDALGDDPPQHDEVGKTPTRRARILHYLATARDTGTVPELAELAGRLRLELAWRWGEVPLDYAPAFRAR